MLPVKLPANFNAVKANVTTANAALIDAKEKLEATIEWHVVKAAEADLVKAQQVETEIRAAVGDHMESEGLDTFEASGVTFKLGYTPGSFKIKDEAKFLEKYPQFARVKTVTEPDVAKAKGAMKEGFAFDPELASLIQKREVKILDA